MAECEQYRFNDLVSQGKTLVRYRQITTSCNRKNANGLMVWRERNDPNSQEWMLADRRIRRVSTKAGISTADWAMIDPNTTPETPMALVK
jgi:hypothetical protein